MKNIKIKAIETGIGKSIEDYLKSEIGEKGRGIVELADELGLSRPTIRSYMKKAATKKRWSTFEDWMNYGKIKEFYKKYPGDLINSEDREEKKWYCRGMKKKWLLSFPFLSRDRWSTSERWIKYGIDRGYNNQNPKSFENSNDKEKKKWYGKGCQKRWVSDFPFKRKKEKVPWKNKEEWIEYGLEKGYNNRNSLSLAQSEDGKERSWYQCGNWRHWLENFSFQRQKNHYVSSNDQFLKLLEDPFAKNMAALALSSGSEGFDIDGLLLEIFKNKFRDRKELHVFLETNKKEISDLVKKGVTNLGAYVGEFSLNERKIIPILLGEVLSSIQEERITPSLEDKLGRMLWASYSPQFNRMPEEILSEIEKKIYGMKGKAKEIYQKTYNYYRDILKMRDEIK